MRITRKLLVPLAAVVVVTAMATAGCGSVVGIATVAGQPDPVNQPDPAPWAPSGAAPVKQISTAGKGETVVIDRGERISFPVSEDVGGYQVIDPAGVLIQYGDFGTWLAMADGTVKISITEYDHSRPCVPPHPVGEFSIRVTKDGTVPVIPLPVELPVGDNVTVHLVPGQQLRLTDIGHASTGSRRDNATSFQQDQLVVQAVRPGSDEYSIWTEKDGRGDPDRSATVVVDDPNMVQGSSSGARPDGLRGQSGAIPGPAATDLVAAMPARCG